MQVNKGLYNIDGNLASVAYPDETLAFAHDGDGLLLSASNSVGVVSNGFDAANRLAGIAAPAATFSFGYCDWNGRLSSITSANGFVVEYLHDIMDRVTNIAWKTTSGATLGGFAYRYDAVGRIVSRDHSLGDSSQMSQMSQSSQKSYTYDALDRLASDGGVTYNYDAAGCVTRIERDGKPTLDLTWDSQYQIVSVSTNGVFAEGYEHDALGRRVSTTTIEGTTHQ